MGSRIKDFLFGRGKPKSTSNTIGSPYSQYVAADLPVNGSHPIAGNGPKNVLEVAQRSRAGSSGSKPPSAHSRWQSRIGSPTSVVPPVPVQPVQSVQYHYDEPARPKTSHGRPQTAPDGEGPAFGWESLNNYNGRERTRSGFSTQSPPPFFTSNEPLPIINVNVHQEVKIHREVQVYQPKGGPDSRSNSTYRTATPRGRQRSNESAARKPFVDLLDAQSTFAPSREVSRHRTTALGSRNYGEDVADRNIRHYGTGAKPELDIDSPDLSYLKSLYPPKKGVRVEGTESRAASALGHVLGHDLRNASDDTGLRSSRVQATPSGTPTKKPIAAVASGLSIELTAAPNNDDHRPTTAYESDRRGRNLLSPSTITPSDTRPSTGVSRSTSTLSRGRRRALKEPPPVPPPAELVRFLSPSRNVNSATNPTKLDRKRRHTLSAATSKTTKNTEKSTKKADRRSISQSESRSFSLTSLSLSNLKSPSISSLKSPLASTRFREEKSPIQSPLRTHPLSNSHSESRSFSLTSQPALRLTIPSPSTPSTRNGERSPTRPPRKADRYSKSHSETRSFSLTSLSAQFPKIRPTTRNGERSPTRSPQKADRYSKSHSETRSFSLTSRPALHLEIPHPSTRNRERSPTRLPQKTNRYSKSHSETRSFSLTSLSAPFPKIRPTTRNGERLAPKANRQSNSHSTPRSFSLTSASNPTMAEGAGRLPNLDGIVDLKNTVDTDVTTKTLKAVTHENVTRERHKVQQERVTREVHYHDVYHRALPVIDTEILPTKHYMPKPDGAGLVEIPESTLQHSPTWKIVLVNPRRCQSMNACTTPYQDIDDAAEPPVISLNGHRKTVSQPPIQSPAPSLTQSSTAPSLSHSHEAPSLSTDEDCAEPPIVSLTRDPKAHRARSTSRNKAGAWTHKILEPILHSKKEYATSEGVPRTEYVWHHQPVFEDALNRTQPVYIGAGLGDLSSPFSLRTSWSSDEDSSSFEGGKTQGEEGLLFRDSGYGSGSAGMLPGLEEKSPMAGVAKFPRFGAIGGGFNEAVSSSSEQTDDDDDGDDADDDDDDDDAKTITLGRVVGDTTDGRGQRREGEATKALHRLREKKSRTIKDTARGGISNSNLRH